MDFYPKTFYKDLKESLFQIILGLAKTCKVIDA
jgi:hypothetical protein